MRRLSVDRRYTRVRRTHTAPELIHLNRRAVYSLSSEARLLRRKRATIRVYVGMQVLFLPASVRVSVCQSVCLSVCLSVHAKELKNYPGEIDETQ